MTGKASGSGETGVAGGKARWVRFVVLGVVCALVIGIFAGSASSEWSELYGSHPEDNYYNLLVQGFHSGQLNLKREVPSGLRQMADPYDPVANLLYRNDDRYPLNDMSYFRGKLYLYFGVTPALVLFWPYAALTGHYLPHEDALVVFCAVGFLVSVGLLYSIWRRCFPKVGLGVMVAATLALGLVTGVPVIMWRFEVCDVPISCGYALTMVALAAIWGALQDSSRRNWWLASASLAYGLALGSRPSLLFGAVILLAPVVQAWHKGRRIWHLLTAAMGPIVLLGIGLMLYNSLRFQNPFEFGDHYQLCGRKQVTMQNFSLSYIWFNFRVYLLEPARWSSHFPFIRDMVMTKSPLPAGHSSIEYTFGILTNLPLVWLVLAVPLAWRDRSEEARYVLRGFLCSVALLFAICAFTLGTFWAACLRYEMDFLPALVLLAVIGILGLERALTNQKFWRNVARWSWGGLLTLSVAFSLFGSVQRLAQTQYQVGMDLLEWGRVEEAIAHFQKALHIQPDNPIFQNSFGVLLVQKGQVDAAIAHYQRALGIQPDFALAHFNLGNALLRKGQVDEAIIHFRKALAIEPDFSKLHIGLGMALLRKGSVDEAITHFQKALEIEPGDADTHGNLGFVLLQKGLVDEAIAQLQKALETKPGLVEAHNNLGNALLLKGQAREAMAHYRKALELQPVNVDARNNLAWLLATSRDASVCNGVEAVKLAQQANQLSGGTEPQIIATLAAAYAEAGRFPEAIASAEQALQLASAQTNTALVDALQIQIKSYQAGIPFRDPSQTNTR